MSALAVGLTGGIGCGKTTVAALFAHLGAAVIDTDEIAHALTGPRGAAMDAIAREFGPRFVGAAGGLDRAAMRSLVFEDAIARARLESILHPAIRREAERRIDESRAPYALVAVPLLFETGGWVSRVARTLVVDCDEALQVERAAARPGMTADGVRSIMRTQWPRWRRLQLADDVVWNGGAPGALAPQCARLHARYERLAREAA
ncbi:MAG TPA: dephospho-CoA kinase [Usitatibacter sp.]|nr:dephospho-CoA kinase [Usitatibacter sp.]